MHMHNINKMTYVGIEPWHGLGVRLPANATYRQIAELAGFYTAEEKQLFIEDSNLAVPDKKAVVRGDACGGSSTSPSTRGCGCRPTR
jgi:hypothetical protein